MKPIELLPRLEELQKQKYQVYGITTETKMLEQYQYDNCVVAYVKNCLGTIFVIKGSKIFMGFILTEKKIRGCSLFRISLWESCKLLNHKCEKDRLHIINPELWARFQDKIALMELNDTEKALDYRGRSYYD